MSTSRDKYDLSPENDTIDMVVVESRKVSCDGAGGALGHPRVWLDMGQDNQVECKYCDRIFVLSPKAKKAGH